MYELGSTVGPYQLEEVLGRGGMATVYRAHQTNMSRSVAIKLMHPHATRDAAFIKRFKQEAQTIAQLEHQHILPVYDFGEDEGTAYLVMRYLDGGTLMEVLSTGQLATAEITDIVQKVATALDYAHRQGIIHRDVKPANVMIDMEGGIYLTDFGIAKVLESDAALTGTGVMIGTPSYMAPEMVQGGGIDARTDIYALGVMLYEMVAGRKPFEGDTPIAVIYAHVNNPLPPIRDYVPDSLPALEKVIEKALAKDPDERYQTAAEMADALRQVGAEEPAAPTLQVLVETAQANRPEVAPMQTADQLTAVAPADAPAAVAPPVPPPTPTPKPRRWGIALAVAGLAVLLIGTVLALNLFDEEPAVQQEQVTSTKEEATTAATDPTEPPPAAFTEDFDSIDPAAWESNLSGGCSLEESLLIGSGSPDQTGDCGLLGAKPELLQTPHTLQMQIRLVQAESGYGEMSLFAATPDWSFQGQCGIAVDGNGVRAYVRAGEDEQTLPAQLNEWITLTLAVEEGMLTCWADDEQVGAIESDKLTSGVRYGINHYYDAGTDVRFEVESFSRE